MSETMNLEAVRASTVKVGDTFGTEGYVLTHVGPIEDGLIRANYTDENGANRIHFFAYDALVMVAR